MGLWGAAEEADKVPRLELQPAGDGLAVLYGAIVENESASLAAREAALFFSLAERHLEAGDVEPALSCSLDALGGFRANNNAVGLADAMRLVIHCFHHQEKYQFATEMALEELALFAGSEDALGQGKMLLSLAELGLARGEQEHLNLAMCQASQALDLFGKQEASGLQAMAQLTVAQIHLQCRDGDRQEHLRQAQDAATKASTLATAQHDLRGLARAQCRLSVACGEAGDTSGALTAAAQALELGSALGDKRLEARALHLSAEWHLHSADAADTAQALADVQQALALFRELRGATLEEASALCTLARVYCAKQQPTLALTLAREGVQQLRMAGERAAEARALDAVIHAHWAAGDGPAALRVTERARACFQALGNPHMEGLMLRRASRLQLVMSETGGALEAAEEALVVSVGSPTDEAEALLQVVRARLESGLIEEALKAVGRASALFRALGDLSGQGASALEAASVYASQGIDRQVGAAAFKAVSFFREAGNQRGQARALATLCEVQMQCGDFQKALNAADLAREIMEMLHDGPGEAEALLLTVQVHLKRRMDSEEHGDAGALEESTVGALAAAGEAVALCREDEEQYRELLAQALFLLAEAELVDGRPQEVLEDLAEAHAIFEELGDVGSQAACMNVRCRAHFVLGEDTEAWEVGNEALAIYTALDDQEGEEQMTLFMEQFGSKSGSRREEEGGAVGPQVPKTCAESPGKGLEELGAKVQEPGTRLKERLKKQDVPGGSTLENVQGRIFNALAELRFDEEVEIDAGLMQSGLTSSSVVVLRNMLAVEFPTVNLPVTLAFDYPSVGDIARFIVDRLPAVKPR